MVPDNQPVGLQKVVVQLVSFSKRESGPAANQGNVGSSRQRVDKADRLKFSERHGDATTLSALESA